MPADDANKLTFDVDLTKYEMDRLHAISQSVQMVYKNLVEGDVAEFGVNAGTSLQVIAKTMRLCDGYSTRFKMPMKRLHGFDSFQGFPDATLQGDLDSPRIMKKGWGNKKVYGDLVTQLKEALHRFLPEERVFIYEGFFAETLGQVAPDVKFALVNIDCDMYVSTREVLEDLFGKKRLCDGCVLLFDDYIENRGSRKFGQRKAWEECKAKYAPDVTDLGPYAIGGWRFIVHVED